MLALFSKVGWPAWSLALLLLGYCVFAASVSMLSFLPASVGGIAFRVTALVIGIVGLRKVWTGDWSFRRNDAFLLALVVLGAMLIRLIVTLESQIRLPMDGDGARVLAIFVGSVCAPFVFSCCVAHSTTARNVHRALLLIGLVGGGIVVIAAVSMSKSYASLVQGRASTENLNPIAVGHFGVTLCLIGLTCVADRRIRDELGQLTSVLFASLLVALGVICIASSGSRGPALALVVMLCVGCVRVVQRRVKLNAIVWPSLVLLLINLPLFVDRIGFWESAVGRRILLSDRMDVSVVGRKQLFPNTLAKIEEFPLFGYGMSEPISNEYPHNAILESLLVGGWFVGGVFIVFFAGVAWWSVKIALSESDWSFFGFLGLQYIVFLSTSSSLYLNEVFWCVALVVSSVVVTDEWRLISGSKAGGVP